MDEVASAASADTKEARSVRSTYPRYIFGVLFAVSFLNYLDRFVFAGATTQMAKDLGLTSLSDVGFIASAFLVVYTLATVPLGIWADRTKRKNVVAFCVAAWSVATALTALATNFTTLFLSRMVLGIGEGGYFPAGTALLSDYYGRARRARVMSLWGTAQLFGILGGYGIGGALAGLYAGGWRLAFIFTGIPGLLLAFLMWRVREPRRNQADEEAAELAVPAADKILEGHEEVPSVASRVTFAQFATLLRVKTLVVLILMQIFAFFVLGVSTTFLPTYMQQKDTFKFLPGPAGIYSGVVIVVAGGAGTVLGGYLADLLDRRHPGARVLICGIGLLCAAPVFAIAVLYNNLTVFTIFFIVTALLIQLYAGPSTAATQDVVPSWLRASALALSLLIAHLLGDAFAPSLVGVIATAFDPTHGQHFLTYHAGHDLSMALFITCSPALLIAGLIGIFGARWMAADVEQAEQADLLARSNQPA